MSKLNLVQFLQFVNTFSQRVCGLLKLYLYLRCNDVFAVFNCFCCCAVAVAVIDVSPFVRALHEWFAFRFLAVWGIQISPVIQCDYETDAQAKSDKAGQRQRDRERDRDRDINQWTLIATWEIEALTETGEQEKPGVAPVKRQKQPYLARLKMYKLLTTKVASRSVCVIGYLFYLLPILPPSLSILDSPNLIRQTLLASLLGQLSLKPEERLVIRRMSPDRDRDTDTHWWITHKAGKGNQKR